MKATNKAKQKIWIEIWSMPPGVEPTDKLLLKNHMFIRRERWEKLNAADGHRRI